MIPKASQRAGGQQLATHLMNAYDNERVEVAAVRGAIANDLHGAFAEWRAVAKATRCRKYLYSLSLNPDPRQGPLTREQYEDFIDRAEKKLGLAEQPRAVIFHVKEGREHAHVVWSRIDKNLRAVQLSHDHQKLRAVARDFARDHGIELPRGMRKDRGADRFSDQFKRVSLADRQQQERTGISKAERVRDITNAWKETKSARDFLKALESKGYLLARGSKRAYVIVDRFGEIHSLARQIQGVRSKEVKARLSDYPLEKLPAADKAQAFARERREELMRARDGPERKAPEKSQMRSDTRLERLKRIQAERRQKLHDQARTLRTQQQAERATLAELQQAERAGIAAERARKKPRPLVAFLRRITGIEAFATRRRQQQDIARAAEHERQRAALDRRHRREVEEIRRRHAALSSIEKRELRSVRTAQRREQFRSLFTDVSREGPARARPSPRKERGFLSRLFGKAARKEETERENGKHKGEGGDASSVRDSFTEKASPPAPPGTEQDEKLTRKFDEALKSRASRKKKEDEREKEDRGRRGPRRGSGNDRKR